MAQIDFENAFEQLTGNRPFPWQSKLFHRMRLGPESIPARCDIPTGLGKTSVIAVWLLAREVSPALPRRLVYVVNRRTVVDQTTFEVEKYKKRLKEQGRDIAVSTLRGQFADNREWSADPSREAIICGTVDMIGSRLLFGGYGIGFRGKPLHAGFLGQDTLIVHDEAHLEPAFQDLLLAIEHEQRHGRFPDRHPLRMMDLSATSRSNAEVFGLTEEEKHAAFDRTDVSTELRTVWKRTHAKKTVALHPVHEEKKELADRLAGLTLAHEATGGAILVFVRTVDDLGKVVAKLTKDRTKQLTGTMRGYEREGLLTDPIFARFLPESDILNGVIPADGAVYLVCTSAGEVGVNISADHLVCDLTTFESMAQRFGRVNRFGVCDNTRIDVVYPETFDEKDELTPGRQKTLDLLRQLGGNANPDALGKLDAAARAAAFAPLPTMLPTSDILFDAWSMTSIRDKMPGRPPLEPYLHGIRTYEPAETRVAWREEVGVIVGDLLKEYPPEELLDAYPVMPHEILRDRTDRVWKELVKLAERHRGRPAWIVDQQGEVDVRDISELARWDKKQADARLGSTTVLLPYDIGGLTTQGTLSGDVPPLRKTDESPEPNNNDVADKWSDHKGPVRKRVRISLDNSDSAIIPKGMKPVYRIVFPDATDEEGEPTEEWLWFARTTQANPDARSRSSYDLDPHLGDAKEAAARFVSGLSLDPDLRDAVILAASCHDLGKDRQRWQRGIGNDNYPQTKWAKSGTRRGRIERSRYRHEFGSMLDIQSLPAFQALSGDSRELVLHLIAAHHGRARPHFMPDECLDDKHPGQTARQQSIDALNRFARLQRRFGRWGLAYLESLVRAADYAASELADSSPSGGAQ